jgi:hypothetical protein
MSKRITLPITQNLNDVREQIKSDMGIELTYTQLIDFLIHFYLNNSGQPKTQWRPIK